jgi:hypothetical protein
MAVLLGTAPGFEKFDGSRPGRGDGSAGEAGAPAAAMWSLSFVGGANGRWQRGL